MHQIASESHRETVIRKYSSSTQFNFLSLYLNGWTTTPYFPGSLSLCNLDVVIHQLCYVVACSIMLFRLYICRLFSNQEFIRNIFNTKKKPTLIYHLLKKYNHAGYLKLRRFFNNSSYKSITKYKFFYFIHNIKEW